MQPAVSQKGNIWNDHLQYNNVIGQKDHASFKMLKIALFSMTGCDGCMFMKINTIQLMLV